MPISSSKSKRIFHAAILLIGIFALSYFREYIFLGINQVLKHGRYQEGSIFEILISFPETKILIFKWGLSILFAFFTAVLTSVILNYIYYPYTYFKTTAITFVALLSLSFACVSISYVTNNYESGYYLSRVIMGFTQSPIVLLFLIPAIKLSEK